MVYLCFARYSSFLLFGFAGIQFSCYSASPVFALGALFHNTIE